MAFGVREIIFAFVTKRPYWSALVVECSVVALLVLTSANAQAETPTIDPAVFGFNIPNGPLKQGTGERVTTHDEEGQSVVARVHVDVGDNRIVMLPDGQLVARKNSETTATDQPFKPMDKATLATRLTEKKFKGFKTKVTRHFVFIYNTSEDFAFGTSKVLESMVPGMMRYLETNKIKSREPDLPLVVLMFRTEQEFQAYQKMPSGVVAYYSPLTNHVVLYEESKLGRVKEDLGVQQAIATIAHEGAHQILHNIGVQQRLSFWPMWLSEGLAEYFAPTSTGKNLLWKGAGEVNDMRMFELEQYLKSHDTGDADGELIEKTVVAARLTSTGYATAWSLTHFLAKQHRVDFHKYVAEVSKLAPLEGDLRVQPPGIIPSNRILFKQFLRGESAEMEKKLVLHLKKLPYNDPFSDYPHFVTTVWSGSGNRVKRDANLFHSSAMAEKWRQDSVGKLPLDQRNSAKTEIKPFPNRATAEAYARQWLQGN